MKIDYSKLKKRYYSIGEVSDLFVVNPSLLRFWEKEFPGLRVRKTKAGQRLYTLENIHKIDEIFHLVKEQGYTLDGAKKAIKTGVTDLDKGSDNLHDVLEERLNGIKKRLFKIKEKLSSSSRTPEGQ